MRAGGVSLQGGYHDENQDAYWVWTQENACALAVSDGLGSKARSAVGSRAFCDALRELLRAPAQFWPSEPEELCEILHGLWLEKLDGVPPEACGATALVAIAREGILLLAALGDGCLAASTDGGAVTVLRDEKPDRFSNETDCLTEMHAPGAWRVRKLPFQSLEGLLAFTDGLELSPDNDETLQRFAGDLFDAYRTADKEAIQADITRWLSGWPGEDDKTIAYCVADGTPSGEGEESR